MTRVANSWMFDALLILMFAWMILPMIGLALWYHGNIGGTEGGRRLMAKQNRNAPIPRVNPKLGAGLKMGRDIEAGAYGDTARRMQHKVYWSIALWLGSFAGVFALMLWVDAYRVVPG